MALLSNKLAYGDYEFEFWLGIGSDILWKLTDMKIVGYMLSMEENEKMYVLMILNLGLKARHDTHDIFYQLNTNVRYLLNFE